MANDFTPDQQRHKKHAALYFDPRNSKAFKALASRVRAEGGATTLVDSSRWKGPENLLMEVRAIIVQKGCRNDQVIIDAYQQYAHDVEIHLVNEDGEFDEDVTSEEPADDHTEADAPVPEPAEDDDGEREDDHPEAVADDEGDVQAEGVEAGPEGSTDPGGDALDGLEK